MQPSKVEGIKARRLGAILALAAALIAGGAGPVSAGAPLETEKAGTSAYIHVVAESWYPYSYEENGEVKGRATETVRKVLARAGVAYDINLYPWSRAYRMAQERKNLLVYAMVKTPAREKAFQFVGQVMEGDRFYFFGMKDRTDIRLASAEDAKGFRIATTQDSAMMAFLKDNEYPDVHSLFDVQLGFKQLRYGRVDLVLTTAVNVAAHVRSGDIEPGSVVPYGWAFDAEPYMAFSPQTDPALVARVRAAYEALVQEGELPVFGAKPLCGLNVLTDGVSDEGCGDAAGAAKQDVEDDKNGGARGDR